MTPNEKETLLKNALMAAKNQFADGTDFIDFVVSCIPKNCRLKTALHAEIKTSKVKGGRFVTKCVQRGISPITAKRAQRTLRN